MKPKIKPHGSLPAFAGGIDTVLFHESGEHPVQTIRYQSEGLTKRELFAAMAMQGMLSNVGAVRNHGNVDGIEIDLIAPGAVRCADALLAELAKDPQS